MPHHLFSTIKCTRYNERQKTRNFQITIIKEQKNNFIKEKIKTRLNGTSKSVINLK
jgi:hypothetical protein